MIHSGNLTHWAWPACESQDMPPSPKSSPRTPDARSGRPSFGHSSPASGSWSAGPSGSPAPWCSPGDGCTGCPGSALARRRLSARAHRRETVLVLRLRIPFPVLLLLPRTPLALHIHQEIPRDLGETSAARLLLSDGAAVPFPSFTDRICLSNQNLRCGLVPRAV